VARVMVVELPALTVALVAPEVRLKLGARTVKATEVVRVIPPPVPVMVTVELPAAAFAAAVKVAVTGAELVTLAEENCTVTPAGAPVAERVAGEVKPPCPVSAMVAEPTLPGAMETLAALGVSVKLEVT
jgi:hypothetical protein